MFRVWVVICVCRFVVLMFGCLVAGFACFCCFGGLLWCFVGCSFAMWFVFRVDAGCYIFGLLCCLS